MRALVFCDTRAAADSPEAAANRLATAERVMREGPGPVADGMLPKLTAKVAPKMHPEVIETLRQMILSTDPRGIAAAARGMAQRPDATAWLPQIACPTLVLVGQEMPFLRSPRARSPRRFPAQLVEIGAGHMSPMENPAEVNVAVGVVFGRAGIIPSGVTHFLILSQEPSAALRQLNQRLALHDRVVVGEGVKRLDEKAARAGLDVDIA